MSQNGNSLGTMIEKARAEARSNPQPTKKKKDMTPRMTLKERLLAAARSAESVSALQQTLEDARECQTTPEIVQGFARLFQQAEMLATYHLIRSMSEKDALKEWKEAPWSEKMELLETLSEEDQQIQSLKNGLDGFSSNIPLRDFLSSTYERFRRPLLDIETTGEMEAFLDRGAEEGYFNRIPNPTHGLDTGVVVANRRGERILYTPRKESTLAKAGWVFVQDAFEHTKRGFEKFDALCKKATLGLSPNRISRGAEGSLFLELTDGVAVLVKTEILGGLTHIKFVEAIGVSPSLQEQETAQAWDDRYSCLKGVLSDFWEDVNKAIKELNAQLRDEHFAQKRKKEARLEPLIRLATANFPTHFAEQSLSRMMRGEEGTLAFWNWKFNWGKEENQKEGLFGLALKLQNGKFQVLEVVSASCFFFDRREIGEQLELTIEPENLQVSLKEVSVVEKRRYVSRAMVMGLLRSRLSAEKKFAASTANGGGSPGA